MSDPFNFDDSPGFTPAPPPPPPKTPGPLAEGLLTGLNESQSAAVRAVDGPVLVLAGAGTGKTRVLTTRLAYIMALGRARPFEVLAVTFTNKAAREMQERVAVHLGRSVEGWWVGTFHALAARILRAHAEVVGLKSNFTILDTDDQLRLIKQLLDVHDIDPKRWPPRHLLGVIERWKDRGLTPEQVSDAAGADVADGRVLEIYGDYQDRLRTLNACDFGDLLLHCLTLFKLEPDILKKYQRQFRYILVDEYQDTNVCQYLWLRALAMEHKNLCCVGDDDQSIYSWRGAEVGNILRFEDDFPGATVVRLERNYRSTPNILAAASGLIANNAGRLGKTLWTDDDDPGDLVKLSGVWDGEEEARGVGDEIEVLQNKGHALSQIAILVRAGFQTREFEERLITLGIPYRVIGGVRFYERAEIRDAVAYLRVIHQPSDDLAFERIINVPKRGIGKAAMQTIHALARRGGMPMTRAVQTLLETEDLQPKARKNLGALMDDFDRWRQMSVGMDPSELAQTVLDESGYTEMLQMDKSIEAPGRLDNLKELAVALEDFENLGAFLEHVSLVMENEEDGGADKVNLMTLHGAKGLEFDTVFLPGWEEGLFPHQRALDETGLQGLEEERRLAYVGLTRARNRAFVSYAANRRVYGNWQSAIPSRFIDELPADRVEASASQGVSAGVERQERSFFADDGWRQSKPRQRRRDPLIEAETWRSEVREKKSDFDIGERVFHQKFGYGRITAVDGDKLEIAFEKAGTKKVMAGFVESPP